MILDKIFSKIIDCLPVTLVSIFLGLLIAPYFYFKYVPKELVTTQYVVTDKYIDDDDYYFVINNKPVKTEEQSYNKTMIGVEQIKQERKYVGFNYYLDIIHTIVCYIALFILFLAFLATLGA